MEYTEFLKTKVRLFEASGFDIEETNLNSNLFDFQKFAVKTALKKGKYALFLDTGLGKTICQLEWAHQVAEHTNKPVLILAPLAVSGQTIQEGKKFNIRVEKWNEHTKPKGVYITNYEQLHKMDVSVFSGVVLDESSILKNFDGKFRSLIIDVFSKTDYKLACTATPSPNDHMELGNHAEFLNVMGRSEMLAMYFVHDGGETQKWRLKKHAQKDFWLWVSSWALCVAKPSDIGFDDNGFILPKLEYHEYQIQTDQRNNGVLFNDVAVSATNFNQELRLTKEKRIKKTIDIVVSNPNELFIIWIKQNEEADTLKKELLRAGINDFKEVRGNERPDQKEEKLLGFAKNEFRILITKSKIAQFGLNYQNCQNQIFVSLDFSFESLYQSVRRSYRFGQKKPVNVYIITTDTMQNVTKAIKDKEKQFKIMQDHMTHETHEYYINEKRSAMQATKSESVITDQYKVIHGDCVQESKNLSDGDADLIVFSPPFADLYVYSDLPEDIGNVKNYAQFEKHFHFLIPELKRILKPGRICAVHCADLPIQKGKEGYIGLRDFSGLLVRMFTDVGFIYHSRVTIWKDPVTEMQRTKALGLLHKQLKKDSTMCRVGIPDYVLFFRNNGENTVPVNNSHIPVELWQKWASPIWYDINYSNTLQYTTARDNKDEKHICPLQLDTIERVINLYSNNGETVFSPFGGIGSEGFKALTMGRKSISIELKKSYFDVNVRNHQNAVLKNAQLSLV